MKCEARLCCGGSSDRKAVNKRSSPTKSSARRLGTNIVSIAIIRAIERHYSLVPSNSDWDMMWSFMPR
jgi:hypothetical protein